MSHEHHNHTHNANKKVLLTSFIIITVFMIMEVIGGLITNSLALLADAGHMLSDALSLLIALIAFTLGERAANFSKTYGYKRFEILAAIFNGATLLIISLFIFYEAFQRFSEPPEVASTGMLIIASIGLIVNIVVAFIMHRSADTKGNLNMRAAFLHVIGDLLGSVGAIVAALLMIFFDWNLADPVASVLVAVLILIAGWRVMRESVHVLMEGTPTDVSIDHVVDTIKSINGVNGLHDLHVWSITSGQHAMSAHVVVNEEITMADSQNLLRRIEDEMENQGINHVTVQFETDNHPHEDSLICQLDHTRESDEHAPHH